MNYFCVYNVIMKRSRGRPKKTRDEAAVERLDLRLTTIERAEYEQAAQRQGKTLSAWIRDCLGRAAKRANKTA